MTYVYKINSMAKTIELVVCKIYCLSDFVILLVIPFLYLISFIYISLMLVVKNQIVKLIYFM